MEDLKKDGTCFVCGSQNPKGLHIRPQKWEKGSFFEFVAEKSFCGWNKYLHGGVISLLFDELLGWTSRFLGYKALTARLEIRYRKVVPIGTKLLFRGELKRERRGLLFIDTVALFEDGSVAAEGKGTMMVVGKEDPSPPKNN